MSTRLPDLPEQDNVTHHLVPRTVSGARVHVCTYCGRTEKELRDALPADLQGQVTWQECPQAPRGGVGPVHKAQGDGTLHCRVCYQRVHAVTGGKGTIWVHTDSGCVAAPGPFS